MFKDKLLPISIFTLAFSIIIAASNISSGIETNGRYISDGIFQGTNNINTTIRDITFNDEENKSIFKFYEASVYLGISESNLREIINNDESKIPHINIKGDIIFSKNALDKWIQESNFKM